MKLVKKVSYRCAEIVQPGEYLIDRWDNKPCEETNPYYMVKCPLCDRHYCHMMHWPKHNCSGE